MDPSLIWGGPPSSVNPTHVWCGVSLKLYSHSGLMWGSRSGMNSTQVWCQGLAQERISSGLVWVSHPGRDPAQGPHLEAGQSGCPSSVQGAWRGHRSTETVGCLSVCRCVLDDKPYKYAVSCTRLKKETACIYGLANPAVCVRAIEVYSPIYALGK